MFEDFIMNADLIIQTSIQVNALLKLNLRFNDFYNFLLIISGIHNINLQKPIHFLSSFSLSLFNLI